MKRACLSSRSWPPLAPPSKKVCEESATSFTLPVRYQFRPIVQLLAEAADFVGLGKQRKRIAVDVQAAIPSDEFKRTPTGSADHEGMVGPGDALVAGVLAGEYDTGGGAEASLRMRCCTPSLAPPARRNSCSS